MVYEGQKVELAGIVMVVRYSDESWARITNPAQLAVSPRIYDWRITQNTHPDYGPVYNIKYKEGFTTVDTDISWTYLGTHRRLLDISWTGSMKKQNYLIDEYPNFDGLTVEGVYNNTDTWDSSSDDPLNTAGPEATYYHKHIPLSIEIPEYQWRWVWNSSQFLPDRPLEQGDAPGVLIKIGSFGDLSAGYNAPYAPATPGGNGVQLVGKRIPVSNIYQLKSINFVNEPAYSDPIFFDDPSLIGKEVTNNLGWDYNWYWNSRNKWIDTVFQGLEFELTYYGTSQTKTIPIRDIITIDGGYDVWLTHRNDVGPVGVPGLWEFLDFWPVFANNSQIGNNTADWSTWARLKAPRMRFYYRSLYVDTVVPVFTRLESIDVVSRDGETPVMNGNDLVYRQPDELPQFLSKVRVTATYSKTGDSATTATRDDVEVDQANGILRKYYDTVDGIRTPILYSTNITYAGSGILTATNSTAYLTKNKLANANVTLMSTDDSYRRARARPIPVGVINY